MAGKECKSRRVEQACVGDSTYALMINEMIVQELEPGIWG